MSNTLAVVPADESVAVAPPPETSASPAADLTLEEREETEWADESEGVEQSLAPDDTTATSDATPDAREMFAPIG